MNDRVFAVDLQSGYNDLLHVGLSQYDVGVVLEFDVFDGGAAAVFPSGTTAKIQGVRPSGVGFDISCTLTGNVVTVSTVTDMTGEAGSFPVEIRFTASGVDVGTVNFVFQIEKAAHPDGTIDADITHEQDIVDKINQILVQTTPDPTLSISGRPADAKATGDAVAGLEEDLSALRIEVNLDLVADEYVTHTGSIASYSGWSRTDYIDVSTASIIYINNKLRATDYCHFYDAEKNPTGNYFSVSVGNNIIPTNGAKYVVISNQTGSINQGKMRVWLPLSDVTLTESGKPADAKATGDSINEALAVASEINDKFDISSMNCEIFDWSFFGSDRYPYGWRNGRYNSATGESDSSGFYLRTLATSRIIQTVDGAKYFRVSVPTGYAVQVSEFDINDDSFIKTYGDCDVRNDTATTELLIKVEHGKNYKFSVGRFANNDSGNYINDATLINNFKLSIYWTDDYADITEYYFPYIDEKVNRVNQISRTIDSKSMSFIFITDYHSLRNAKQSKKLINYIVKNTGINTVVFGGDAFQNWKSLNESMSEISKVYDTLRKAGESRFFCIYGNHEWNDTTGQLNTLAGVTQITTKGVHNVPVMERYGNYYIDDAISETRTFFLTCSISGSIPWESILWLGNQLLTMPNNWNALVICHAGLLSENGTVIQKNTYANVSKLLGAFGDHVSTTLYDSDNVERGTFDYTNATGTAIAYICGHVHEDLEILKADSAYNMLTFSTTGDLYENASGAHYTFKDEDNNTITRNVGTIYEQAFDVIQIDTYNRKIYCTRIGAGVNREFTF